MKDKVAEAWRRETRTVGRKPLLVDKFAQRLEIELRETISKETVVDKVVEETLERFQTEQKRAKSFSAKPISQKCST
jgi:hypothetical protein